MDYLHSRNGTEFIKTEVVQSLNHHRIHREHVPVDSPKHEGLVEQWIALTPELTVISSLEASRMIDDAKMPTTEPLWPESNGYASDVINLTARVRDKPEMYSPYSTFYRRPPFARLVPFVKSYFHHVGRTRKTETKAEACFYLNGRNHPAADCSKLPLVSGRCSLPHDVIWKYARRPFVGFSALGGGELRAAVATTIGAPKPLRGGEVWPELPSPSPLYRRNRRHHRHYPRSHRHIRLCRRRHCRYRHRRRRLRHTSHSKYRFRSPGTGFVCKDGGKKKKRYDTTKVVAIYMVGRARGEAGRHKEDEDMVRERPTGETAGNREDIGYELLSLAAREVVDHVCFHETPPRGNPPPSTCLGSELRTPRSYAEACADGLWTFCRQAIDEGWHGLADAGTFGTRHQPEEFNVIEAKRMFA